MEIKLSKERKDGLFMDSTIYMIDEKKQGFPIQSRVIQFLVILIGNWGFFGVLLGNLNSPASYLKVNLAIFLCAGFVFTLCLIPTLDLVKLFFGFLFYGLFLYSRLPALQNGFYILENQVIDRLAAYYSFPSDLYLADYTAAITDSTLLFIIILIPVVSLFTIAIVRNHLTTISVVVLFLPVIMSFLFGLIPTERYLVAYLMAVLYLSRSSYINHRAINREQKLLLHRINSRAAVWLSIISLIIFLLLKLFIPEQKYETITEIKETKKDIQTAMFNFSWEDVTRSFNKLGLFYIQNPSGGLDGGMLGDVGKVEFNGSEQLVITAPQDAFDRAIYLKGYVGSDYTGYSWGGHSQEMEDAYKEMLSRIPQDAFEPINQMSQMVDRYIQDGLVSSINEDSMDIRLVDANRNFIYVPYFTDYNELSNIKYKQDLYAAPVKKNDSYSVKYYNSMTLAGALYSSGTGTLEDVRHISPAIKEYMAYENYYKDYVYKAYTKLPEKGCERLIQEFSNIPLKEGSQFQEYYKIQYIGDYLNKNTTYSLSPGKLPKGKDYAEYFLYENKKGYCAHYATAATLMLRAAGIPARYVEGYVVNDSDVRNNRLSRSKINSNNGNNGNNDLIEVSVKDRNAHAWVEIYSDYYGWQLYDFTPGASFANSIAENEEKKANVTPTPPVITTAPNHDKKEDKPETPVTPDKDTTKTSASKNAAAAAERQQQLDTAFFVLFIILLLGSVGFIIIRIVINNKKNQKTWNHNKRAIVLYAEMDKILTVNKELSKHGKCLEDNEEYLKTNCSYIDPEAFSNCMEIVRRARFGKGAITKAELEQVELLHHSLYRRVFTELSVLKKLYLKLLLSI